MLKKIVKKFIPAKLLLAYHFSLAKLAAFYYGHPSEKLIVIGVTGTNGKTTTVNLISQLLEQLGQKNGLASTVNFKVADKEWLNDKKMTMLGRMQTQKLLRDMVRADCRYAVIETSSQGIEQFRHSGINYDLCVFTNLTPEHIEAHGGFENYRRAKEKLFSHLAKSKRKNIDGQKIKKIIISNADDSETERLKKNKVDQFSTYSIKGPSDYQAYDVSGESKASFKVLEKQIKTDLLGEFNIYNSLAAIASLNQLGFSLDKIKELKFQGVPGRQEWIDEGQDFLVMVDYAPEPEGLRQLYKALSKIEKNKIIHVLGSCGGGRDVARQPIMGELAAQNADMVVVTNEDPYDDDPQEIIDNVASGAEKTGKILDKNLFKVLDREKAIEKALKLAKKGDLVLITGKGAEQAMCVGGGQIPWDDRKVARNYLR